MGHMLDIYLPEIGGKWKEKKHTQQINIKR